ncbi:MAG: nucleotidyltransferase domain-containing protein [Planctomycetaceae bacterium]|jgi:predicted nucleotidyltransferase|nr:nucleotidyltransferase domain-containing protein [Planctomycetaceae bacterium]
MLPFMNINETIKNTVVQVLPNSKVILFGSRVRGDFQENSDYDILVIVKNELSPVSKMPYRTSIRKKLLSQNIFSDVLIQSESEILQKQTLTGHIVKNIMEEGMEI